MHLDGGRQPVQVTGALAYRECRPRRCRALGCRYRGGHVARIGVRAARVHLAGGGLVHIEVSAALGSAQRPVDEVRESQGFHWYSLSCGFLSAGGARAPAGTAADGWPTASVYARRPPAG